MICIDDLLKNEVARAEDLKQRIELYKAECPAIIAVLNSHSLTAYKYFKVNLDSLGCVDKFCHNMHHAMIDDGDYSVVRTINTNATDLRKRMKEFYKKAGKEYHDEVVYSYKVVEGDACSKESPAALLSEEDVIEICRLDGLHLEYYEKHKEQIEGEFYSEENKEYARLYKLADEYLEKLWNEDYEKNKDYYKIYTTKEI